MLFVTDDNNLFTDISFLLDVQGVYTTNTI